jgi:hypothetical protein
VFASDDPASLRRRWEEAVEVSGNAGSVLGNAWKQLQARYLAACREAGTGKCSKAKAPPPSPSVPKKPPPPVQTLTLEQELLSGGGRWTFGRVNGPELCKIKLTRNLGPYDAYVLFACHPNESY